VHPANASRYQIAADCAWLFV